MLTLILLPQTLVDVYVHHILGVSQLRKKERKERVTPVSKERHLSKGSNADVEA